MTNWLLDNNKISKTFQQYCIKQVFNSSKMIFLILITQNAIQQNKDLIKFLQKFNLKIIYLKKNMLNINKIEYNQLSKGNFGIIPRDFFDYNFFLEIKKNNFFKIIGGWVFNYFYKKSEITFFFKNKQSKEFLIKNFNSLLLFNFLKISLIVFF